MKSALFLKTLSHLALASLALAYPQAPITMEVDIVIKAETDAPGAAVQIDMQDSKHADLQQQAIHATPTGANVVMIRRQSEWDAFIAKPNRLVVLFVWASWSGPARQLDLAYTSICGSTAGNLDCLKVDIDDTSGQIDIIGQVQVVPTVFLWKNKAQINVLRLPSPSQLNDAIASGVNT